MEEVCGIFARKVVELEILRRNGICKPFSLFDTHDGSNVKCVGDGNFPFGQRFTEAETIVIGKFSVIYTSFLRCNTTKVSTWRVLGNILKGVTD